MYSVMLMMAMTSGGDLPNLGHHGCCGGGYSCCGGSYGGYSCCGGSYGGYSCCGGGYVSSCCGGYSSCCCGGGGHGLFGRRHSSCCGGYSSCCGGYGGYSCCGGGYGGYSCCGGMPCGGTVIYEHAPEGKPVETGKPVEEIKTKPESTKPPESLAPAPATIIVSLPADAKLSIDDAATVSTTATRVFTSPELPVGQDFHYTLKAEYARDGKPVVSSKEITVRAGEQTRVNMEEASGVASR